MFSTGKWEVWRETGRKLKQGEREGARENKRVGEGRKCKREREREREREGWKERR